MIKRFKFYIWRHLFCDFVIGRSLYCQILDSCCGFLQHEGENKCHAIVKYQYILHITYAGITSTSQQSLNQSLEFPT